MKKEFDQNRFVRIFAGFWVGVSIGEFFLSQNLEFAIYFICAVVISLLLEWFFR